MNCIKKISLFILIASVSMSCGLERNHNNANKDPASSVGRVLSISARDLNSSEETVATRICYALRNKRVNFSNIHLGDRYNFRINVGDCNDNTNSTSKQLTITQDSQGVAFSENNNIFFRIETDVYGHLNSMCNKLTKGAKAQNTSSSSAETFIYTFSSLTNKDVFNVFSVNQSSDNGPMTVLESQSFEVTTAGNSSNLLGLVTKYKSTQLCPGTRNTSSFVERTFFIP